MRLQSVCKFLLAGLIACGFHGTVLAQAYPSKIVRIIVPFPPGSGADTTLRLFTPKLIEQTGQQFLVDNRAGAAGNIGAEAASKAPADGYNLLLVPASLATSASLYKDIKFDLIRDFAPIAMLASAPFVMAVHPSVPAKTVKEFIAYTKANPGKVNFASTGSGGINHLSGELLKSMAGIDIVHVAYKGTNTAVPDLIGGQVQLMFTSTVSSLPHVKAGKLRALAISSEKRSLAAPDLPTVSESGLLGYESATWFALFTPTGTPRDLVMQMNALAIRTGQMPDLRDRLISQGAEPQTMTPEQVGAYAKNEMVKWAKVVKEAGVTAE